MWTLLQLNISLSDIAEKKKCNLQDCILLLLFNLLLLYLFKNKKVLEMPQDSNL